MSFYSVEARNSQTFYVWATNESDVSRYVDWLNSGREFDFYSSTALPKKMWAEMEERSDFLSCDEPHWDCLMNLEEYDNAWSFDVKYYPGGKVEEVLIHEPNLEKAKSQIKEALEMEHDIKIQRLNILSYSGATITY